jgi:hypothetical protein
VLELTLAKADGSYQKLLGQIAKTKVRPIEDWGFETHTAARQSDPMEIIDDRHGFCSIGMINQPPTDH